MKDLLASAKIAQSRSYSPYSNARIGAAVRMQDNKIYNGTNVENASYGGTVCAERIAIFKAISEGAQPPIKEILVISHVDQAWPPCGFCRQVIAEFADQNTVVHFTNKDGDGQTVRLIDLLPEAFGPGFLPSTK